MLDAAPVYTHQQNGTSIVLIRKKVSELVCNKNLTYIFAVQYRIHNLHLYLVSILGQVTICRFN